MAKHAEMLLLIAFTQIVQVVQLDNLSSWIHYIPAVWVPVLGAAWLDQSTSQVILLQDRLSYKSLTTGQVI